MILGFSLAVIAAFLFEAIDQRPRDPRRLARLTGTTLGATIRDGNPGEWSALLAAVAAPGGKRVVLITTAAPDEAAGIVADGLREAAEGAGRTVTVVGAGDPHDDDTELVLVVAPILTASADAMESAAHADEVLICATLGAVPSDALRAAGLAARRLHGDSLVVALPDTSAAELPHEPSVAAGPVGTAVG